MEVIYLLDKEFDLACKELAVKVQTEFKPDLVIGILTGGGIVGKSFVNHWVSTKPNYCEVKIKRSLTKKKEKFKVSSVLTKLPRFLTELLIIAEVKYLERKSSSKKSTARIIPEKYKQVLAQYLDNEQVKNVLIIDDCIDTGNTIKVLRDYISDIREDMHFKVATITITHKHPVVDADFMLYNRTICRFPWSMEIKAS